ncbi:MAG TPA: DUF4347 domain-containing protein, partial [Ramlibacter sp.]|uniref:DUF4347 domain-containing protein n=1 Tax=Ramlibacter sp. TaxID=1917967 RepID=UPI002ECFD566
MNKSRRPGPDPENKKNGAGSGIRKRKPQLLALEPRLMFDGAAAATVPEDTSAALSPTVFERVVEKAASPVDKTTDATTASTANDASASTDARAGAAPADGARREIVFVDTTVAAWQTLVSGVREGVQVVLLDPQRDAFAQIAGRLQGERDLDAIHIVSHGSGGTLIVGGNAFDESALAFHAAELEVIAHALSADGDILLYGCDIAAGAAGASFVQALSRATGADVAASTDTTGHAAIWGGDWTLEQKTGTVEAALFASDATLTAYEGKLATINLGGNTGWIPLMFGTSKDPQGDSQAQASDTDIVADA